MLHIITQPSEKLAEAYLFTPQRVKELGQIILSTAKMLGNAYNTADHTALIAQNVGCPSELAFSCILLGKITDVNKVHLDKISMNLDKDLYSIICNAST